MQHLLYSYLCYQEETKFTDFCLCHRNGGIYKLVKTNRITAFQNILQDLKHNSMKGFLNTSTIKHYNFLLSQLATSMYLTCSAAYLDTAPGSKQNVKMFNLPEEQSSAPKSFFSSSYFTLLS